MCFFSSFRSFRLHRLALLLMLLPLFIPIPLVILLNSVNVMHCCTVRQAAASNAAYTNAGAGPKGFGENCRCFNKDVNSFN